MLFDTGTFQTLHVAHLKLMQQEPNLLLRVKPHLTYVLEEQDSQEVGLVTRLQEVEKAALVDTADSSDQGDVRRCSLVSLQRLAQY